MFQLCKPFSGSIHNCSINCMLQCCKWFGAVWSDSIMECYKEWFIVCYMDSLHFNIYSPDYGRYFVILHKFYTFNLQILQIFYYLQCITCCKWTNKSPALLHIQQQFLRLTTCSLVTILTELSQFPTISHAQKLVCWCTRYCFVWNA